MVMARQIVYNTLQQRGTDDQTEQVQCGRHVVLITGCISVSSKHTAEVCLERFFFSVIE